MKSKTYKNQLGLARIRAGLSTEQASVLFGHESVEFLNEIENGSAEPGLRQALEFEIVYQWPIRLLFEDLFLDLRDDIKERWNATGDQMPDYLRFPSGTKALESGERCFYSELLLIGETSHLAYELGSKHVINLMKTLTEIRPRRPWSLI